MDKKQLGRKIHLARKDRGITSEELAERCYINASYLRQIESGAKTPSLSLFVALCQQLRVSPSYLLSEAMSGEEEPEIAVLLELWNRASPQQMKLITGMIRSALDCLQEP